MGCRQTHVKAGNKTIDLSPTQCDGLDLLYMLTDRVGDDACGEHACVYATSDPNMVLKVTDDPGDVYGFIAAKGSGLTPPSKTPIELGDSGLYAFEVGKVTFPTALDEIIFNNAVNHGIAGAIFDYRRPKTEREPQPLRGGKFRFEAPADISDTVEKECKEIVELVKAHRRTDLGTPQEIRERCRYIANSAVGVIEKLGQRGVKFTDVHAGNWGFYKGRLVSIDLGLSDPPRKKAVSKLYGVMADHRRRRKRRR